MPFIFIFAAILLTPCALLFGRRIRRFDCLARLGARYPLFGRLLPFIPALLMLTVTLINPYAGLISSLHLAVIWLCCDGVAALVRRIKKEGRPTRYLSGGLALVITVLYLSIGVFCNYNIFDTRYSLETEKPLSGRSVRVVQLADVHLSTFIDGSDFAALCNRISELSPDIVVITGDFADDDTTRSDMEYACRSLSELVLRCHVFFAWGNHDRGYFESRDFTSKELEDTLRANGVIILEDRAFLVNDSFYVVGRADRSDKDRASAEELLRELDPEKYVIMLDHQPGDYAAEAAAGADLVLSGHTHGGHIFPAGLLGLLMGANDKVYGHEKIANTDFIVTSGVSGWAIPMKTLAISELVTIDIYTK